jgi:hypothetical protein
VRHSSLFDDVVTEQVLWCVCSIAFACWFRLKIHFRFVSAAPNISISRVLIFLLKDASSCHDLALWIPLTFWKNIRTEFGVFGEVIKSPKGLLCFVGVIVGCSCLVCGGCVWLSVVSTVFCDSVLTVDWVFDIVCALVRVLIDEVATILVW